MTWKEFKDAVESKGVKDDTKIDIIDIYSYGRTDAPVSKYLNVKENEDNSVDIKDYL